MAHFARIDDNGIVQEVNAINNSDIDGGHFPDSEPLGQALQAELGLAGKWLQCSISGAFRGDYPAIGAIYDEISDQFINPPMPEPAHPVVE